MYKILLLTNRDSDNLGDQIIEACDLSLIRTVMENLSMEGEYQISSRAAGFITKKYLETEDPERLAGAEETVRNADLVLFGGAPLFNYDHSIFWKRTVITLQLAHKYNKPVLFSAIGIESYDEKDDRCRELKAALNDPCVKMITTRDDMEKLTLFRTSETLKIGKVFDPAVLCSTVFEPFLEVRRQEEKKKIGLFVLRAFGFRDNHIKLPVKKHALLWCSLVKELENRGYDYELLTSGHYGDEAFIDYLIRQYDIPEKKCVFNMNTPEKMVKKISGYDGVISCRLHPGIVSYSLDVPSVGIAWNQKVDHYYSSIGYAGRVAHVPEQSVTDIVDMLEQAMCDGIRKEEAYLWSVYETLFEGIRDIVKPGDTTPPYSFEEGKAKMVRYAGTSESELDVKLSRKFRRAYSSMNEYKMDLPRKLHKIVKTKAIKLIRKILFFL